MISVETGLLRVVYFSRNRIEKSLDEMKWEIDTILERSQGNNGRAGVTGALIFNSGVFGQVLEGPAEAVEETFERIQGDERHFDVTVLDIRPIDIRSFAAWSMGFVGQDAAAGLRFGAPRDLEIFDPALLRSEDIFQSLHSLALRNELVLRAA